MTAEIVAELLLQTPAITTIRFPVVMTEAGVSCIDDATVRPDTRCTNCGEAFGVTAFEAAESPLVPTELVALTVNV